MWVWRPLKVVYRHYYIHARNIINITFFGCKLMTDTQFTHGYVNKYRPYIQYIHCRYGNIILLWYKIMCLSICVYIWKLNRTTTNFCAVHITENRGYQVDDADPTDKIWYIDGNMYINYIYLPTHIIYIIYIIYHPKKGRRRYISICYPELNARVL